MIDTTPFRRRLLDLAITGKLVPKQGEWRTVKFADVCKSFNVGIVIKPTRYYTDDFSVGVRAFRNANIRPNEVDETGWVLVMQKALAENPRCIVHTDDVIIARSGAPGVAAVVPAQCDGYAAIDILIATLNPAKVDARYVSFCLNSPKIQTTLLSLNRGVALAHIGVRTVSELLIPLPPIAEQKAIVKRLEELLKLEGEIAAESAALDDLIAAAKRKILSLAISGRLVPKQGEWKTVKLGEMCEVINGLWKGVKKPFVNVGVIRAANFTKDCKLNLEKTVYIDVEAGKYETRKLQEDDLIVERSGGGPGQPVGRVVLFPKVNGEYSISNFTSILRITDWRTVNPKYLHMALVAIYNTGYTEKIQTQTTNLHNLNFKEYLNTPIPLPSLAEQKEIVARVEELQNVVDALKE